MRILLILSVMLVLEVLLVTLFSGQRPNRMTSTLLANADFFATYLLEAPGTTLKLLIFDKPLFEIAAVHAGTGLDIWRLHYFNYATLVHVGLALLLLRYWPMVTNSIQSLMLFSSGAVLLLSSSLYLFHVNCCSGGPLWIVHTALIADIFNPVTATEARLEVYARLQPWLVGVQVGFALLGLSLMAWRLYVVHRQMHPDTEY
ncbi:MAG: hypothetical protein R6X06_07220 [Gammaproteobacteria bacterium]